MREKLKKVVAYILRTWEDEPGTHHPRLRILPPILWDILASLLAGAILYSVIKYLLIVFT